MRRLNSRLPGYTNTGGACGLRGSRPQRCEPALGYHSLPVTAQQLPVSFNAQLFLRAARSKVYENKSKTELYPLSSHRSLFLRTVIKTRALQYHLLGRPGLSVHTPVDLALVLTRLKVLLNHRVGRHSRLSSWVLDVPGFRKRRRGDVLLPVFMHLLALRYSPHLPQVPSMCCECIHRREKEGASSIMQ